MSDTEFVTKVNAYYHSKYIQDYDQAASEAAQHFDKCSTWLMTACAGVSVYFVTNIDKLLPYFGTASFKSILNTLMILFIVGVCEKVIYTVYNHHSSLAKNLIQSADARRNEKIAEFSKRNVTAVMLLSAGEGDFFGPFPSEFKKFGWLRHLVQNLMFLQAIFTIYFFFQVFSLARIPIVP